MYIRHDEVFKLDSNEADSSPSPLVYEKIREFLSAGHLNWYPDLAATVLREKLSGYTRRPIEEIQVFNGSDSALDHICRTFIETNDHVVISAPTYDNFRIFVEALGANVEFIFGSQAFQPDVQKLLRAVDQDTRLLYLCNPDNPTGRMFTSRDIQEIAERLEHGILIVDEAYFEYSGVTMSELLGRHSNLFITRTFSKAFGLAALRCGYILAHKEHIAAINKIRNGKDVNSLAQVAAAAALDDLDFVHRLAEENHQAKTWLADELNALGFETLITPANYILLRIADPHGFIKCLREQDVYLRDRSDLPQLEHYVRVTVGTLDRCRKLLSVMRAHMDTLKHHVF